ncbi:MAG: YdeI/OmpD-associated family protein [SAR202 cluster bacterium]|nr:YdeI/OmpD-associated family protein [SAR202 cluster bacterium]
MRRPPWQRNDYLSWITLAKGEDTGVRRLGQMLDEPAAGDLNMNRVWRAR